MINSPEYEVEAKARELLATEWERDGFNPVQAQDIRDGYVNNTTATAIRAIAAALRQRPVVDDAMVERALDANIPGGGQVRDFGLPRYAVLAALLAACQQDNGAKR